MTATESNSQDIRIVRFRKGEQIIRQGDPGYAIFKVVNGKVGIYREIEGMEVPLASLGPGEVLGEMIFLNQSVEVHYASAKAMEDSELEVWDPGALSMEYDQMSPVLKFVVDQSLTRLVRMNKIVEQMGVREMVHKGKQQDQDPRKSRRTYYRKKVQLPCEYLPVRPPKGLQVSLKGYVRDLSMTGLGLDLARKNLSLLPHDVGDHLRVSTDLPNGKRLEVTGRIIFVYETRGKVRLGLSFDELDDYGSEARKTLGFFLLPS
ncbi:MAG: cyclic nucleotide-binding domain-containing protein [Desulfatiglandales bacterium]